ncbi:TonB-dependent receptor [Phenylobacterium aquaticum]|uniref:TonB-dependent receptor n=1 Tax=Phenylobacterium aquaticum TaxID=1763816 RepID=UPI0026EEB5D2|nr:TonB-dependent receptor [Phenylobacterium aquaticum]
MKHHLLAGAAAGALLLIAGQACAAEAAATDAGASVEELVVYGKGESRQVQQIAVQEIEQAAPGTSPIKMVEKLPGVNFQSADAFGAYEWSTRISIRGFNQNQLGFTLDGVPLGDMSYGNHNGLHISRAIMSEDLGGVELAQGSGSLNTASASNLGGTLKFVSRDPSSKFGVFAAGTLGSDNMYRGFLRLETGDLPSGGRAYLSYAKQDTDKWKGYGVQKQQQIDFKFVQPIGEGKVSAFYDWSQRRENDYQDLSLEMIKRLGYGFDNISNNYALANQIANTALTHYLTKGTSGDPAYCVSDPGDGTNSYAAPIKCNDDAYFDAGGLRDDKLWSIKGEMPFGDMFNATAQIYGHTNKGQGTWYAPLNPSPNYGVPGATTNNSSISYRTTEYNIDRSGVVLGGDLTLGAHLVRLGGWYEDNDFEQARRYYGLDAAANNRDSLAFQSNPYKTRWHYAFNTKTTQVSLEDNWTVTDALKVNFGFKSLKVENKAKFLDGYGPLVNSGQIQSKDSFLPQVGANYKLNENSEVFGSYTENMRAFVSAATAGPFSTTQAGFDAIKGKLKPESSKTFEAGWRFKTADFQGVIAAYHVKFDNRLLATASGSGVAGNPSVLSNVGSVTTNGFETAGTWNITDAFSLFGSYAYNDSSFDDDVRNGSGGLVAKTAGKSLPDAPKSIANLSLAYDQNGWHGALAAHYTGERYITYTNDLSVPAVTTLDLSLGYTFEGEGLTKGLEIQANVTNLLDKDYVSTIGSNGFSNSGDSQTLLAGAPRQMFVTVRKQF